MQDLSNCIVHLLASVINIEDGKFLIMNTLRANHIYLVPFSIDMNALWANIYGLLSFSADPN